MSKRFKNTLAAPTLYKLGISYHAIGTISAQGSKEKLFDFYTCDKVTDAQKAALLEIAPDVQFKSISPQYAPEIKRVAVCFPKAAFYRTQQSTV